jgi:hypothetical protein
MLVGLEATNAVTIPVGEPTPVPRGYPQCEHGLSLQNCYGPQHYYLDDEERQRYGYGYGYGYGY